MASGREAAAPGRARVRASACYYVVIIAWLAVRTVLGVLARALLPPAAGRLSPLTVDAVALGLSVLPVRGYPTLTEGGTAQATWGKRRTSLRVTGARGAKPGRVRVAVRNGVKLLPWQLAHVSVARIVREVDAPFVIGTTYALSLLLPAVSIAMAWRDPRQRALHDRVAGTRVVPA